MKRISPATVTFGVLAVLCGLVAAYAARRYFEPSLPRNPGVAVVVPRINLPPFSRIRDEDVDLVYLAPTHVPAGAVTQRAQVLFRHVRNTIMAGQPIREEHLYEVGKVPTLAEQVPPGHRAVTVAVDPSNALDGVLLPESLVDISLTVRGDHPELNGVATMTILRGIRVLATNRDRYRTEERLEQNLRSVTVAVTPQQANKLILAQRYGMLSVALCSELDAAGTLAEASDRDLVNPSELLGLGPAREHRAEIWRGTGVEQVTFRAEQVLEAEAATAARSRDHVNPVRYRRLPQDKTDAPVAAPEPSSAAVRATEESAYSG